MDTVLYNGEYVSQNETIKNIAKQQKKQSFLS